MDNLSGFFAILDSRSFSTIWYWLILVTYWALAGRSVVGVPGDVVTAAGRAISSNDQDDGARLLLLDWLSLQLGRWRVTPVEGAVLLGLACFALTCLALLGFGYGLEMAQAMFLLFMPMVARMGLALRAAQKLTLVMRDAHRGVTVRESAARAYKVLRRFRIMAGIVMFTAIIVTALWGTLWNLIHPHGL